jgi:uncharacterized peroxidase-related enzyme
MLSEYKITLAPVSTDSQEKGGDLLKKAKDEMGFVPNMYANMANAPALLDTYMHGYSAFRKGASLSPAEQEVVLLAISRDNGCEYCVAAHSMLAAKQAGVDETTVQALREGAIPDDPKLGPLVAFTRSLAKHRGLPPKQDVLDFLAAGYQEKHILDVVLAIAVKTLSNYSNHLFHTNLDVAFSKFEWKDPEAL